MAELTDEQLRDIVATAKKLDISLTRLLRHEEPWTFTGDAGTNTYDFGRVGPNRILVITHMSAYDAQNAPTYIRLGYWNRTRYVWVHIEPAPLVLETVEFNGELVITEDMWPAIQFNGVSQADDLSGIIQGYWIAIPRLS